MQNPFKLACLAVYLAALVGAVWPFPGVVWAQYLALAIVAVHVLELPFALPRLRQQPGPLIDGVGLTLLFGVLHWGRLKPPAR